MITELVNFLGRTFQTKSTTSVSKVVYPQNPFASQSSVNPFVNAYNTAENNPFYGKNRPVSGGYFAGYYNGKPNIVGTRLFVEA